MRVAGRTPRDTIEIRGSPILYAFTIPLGAPHAAAAARFAAWLLSAEGRRVLRSEGLEPLEAPLVVGDDVPAAVRDAAGSPR